MISNNKISNLVASQLPFYVRNDHENFVAFLEAYYEFMEQQTGAVNISRSMLSQADVDTTDLFLEKFYQNFLPFIPENTLADKTLLLKNIKDFYRSRGTEKSIRFLMRVLFDEEIEFYYPQKDILRVSDGKWFIERSVKISDITVDGVANNDIAVVEKFISSQITGNTSNATALVERVSTYYDSGSLVRELKISGQIKDFESGEQIVANFFENGIQKTLRANLFSGSINSVRITNPGSGYKVGDEVKIESETGNGAIIQVSAVTTGGISGLAVLEGGAGYQVNNPLVFTGGGGTGANGNVLTVRADSSSHPNSYNIVSSTISLEQNTPINNTRYANINTTHVVSRTTPIRDAVSFFRYDNTGPIETVLLYSFGTNYVTKPTISALANTRVRSLNILGKMKIISGGKGYLIGDTIEFINQPGTYGTGAAGRVSNVDTSAQNTITAVEFVNVPGQITGGSGYDQFALPRANVRSSNVQASGANVVVTAVLGAGEIFTTIGSNEGTIQSLVIRSAGSGYETPPTLNLSSIGDGTAKAVATIITGAYTYPGRYINDDGHLSSYNFIQDRDYYQKFSYVVKLKQSIEKYRAVLKNLIHPAGMKLFGEYVTVDNGENINLAIRGISEQISYIKQGVYTHNVGNVRITLTSHGLNPGNTVYLDWFSGNLSNATANVEGPYKVKTNVAPNIFTINTNAYIANTLLPNTSGTVNVGRIIY